MSSERKRPSRPINRMIKKWLGGKLFVLTFLCVGLLPVPLKAQSLLQQSNLVYQGAFRVPHGTFGGSSFDYCECIMAFDPAGNSGAGSLFISGHTWHQQVAEISIPTPVAGSVLANLNTATVLQNFVDPTNGAMYNIQSGQTMKVGGLMVVGSTLYETVYIYYDGNGSQPSSHFYMPKNLSSVNVHGPYTINIGSLNTGLYDGWMIPIPAAYQSSLGGKPYITGNCCLSIISRTSYGPAAFSFDIADLGVINPVPRQNLLYYDPAHTTLGCWSCTGPYFNGSTQIHGAVFPTGTRSVLFWGKHGAAFCYGPGTNDPNQAGQPGPGGEAYCYDPTDSAKGTHGYPYVYQIWAYDVNDLIAVAGATKNPWDVLPYATWNLIPPFADAGRQSGGIAYDAANQKIYWAQMRGDVEGSSYPVIYVYQVQVSTSITPPAPPGNLLVK